jgi:cytochrome c-type biogenesis protein CcmH
MWLVLAVMTLAAAGALVLPYLRTRREVAPRAAYDLEIYRDQLAEIERDHARKLIGDSEAQAARTEVARRALAADTAAKAGAPASPPRRSFAVVAVAGLAPVLAFGVYLATGSPELPGQPLAERLAAGQIQDQELITRLETRLREHPEDVQGWVLLARSYGSLGRFDDAVTAWQEVMRRSQTPEAFAGALGEAQVQAANGTVPPAALVQFEAALKANPADARARFYTGLAKEQAGESRAALQIWTDLAAMSPPDAPWMTLLRERIRAAASAAQVDPASIAPSAEAQEIARQTASSGPSAADVENAAKMSPEERTQMIRGMVEQLAARLEAEPNDVDGWRRLARARRVLGESDKAVEASAKAAALAPDRLDVQTDYAGLLFERLPKDGKLTPEFVGVMRHILDLDPNHGDALWFVGLSEAQAGNKMAAIALWQRLIDRLPADAKERKQVEAEIDALKQTPN